MSNFWSDIVGEDPIGNEYQAPDEPPPIKAPEQVASGAHTSTPIPSSSRRAGAFFVLYMFAIPLLALTFDAVLLSFDDEESPCFGTGEVWYHNRNACHDRIYGQFSGEVGNQTVEGKEYLVYEWEIDGSSQRDDEWIRSAVYARVDFRTADSPVRGHYYTWFECPGLFQCVTDVDFDNKSWMGVSAQQIDYRNGAYSNSTTMFVNIEEGRPLSIAIERDVELSNRPDLVIELIH